MRRTGVFLLLFALGLPGVLPSGEPRRASGRVTGPAGPLAGARVRVKGKDPLTFTGAEGRFLLPVPFGNGRLTASSPGFFIGGVSPDGSEPRFHLEPLPDHDNEEYEWVEPGAGPGEGRCANCHRDIHDEWAGGGHARSATNRHFRDLYAGTDWYGGRGGWSLLHEHPTGARVCSSCHAPTLDEDGPALDDIRRVRGVAARGVHCDYCHKVSGPGSGEIGLTHGRYYLQLLRPREGEGQIFFGPLDDVDRGEDVHSPFYRDSRYCAACHEGVVFGVRVYSTYSEWRQSPAARAGIHCQHCHMKPTGKMDNVAPGRGGIRRDPWTLANHRFWDGSQLDMLRRALHLDVWVTRGKDQTRAEVRLVARNVGHRIPTGFIDRQLLLVVEGLDETGQATTLTHGPRLPTAAGEELAGLPGELYTRLLRDEKGNAPVPFWRAVPDPVDTRLVPERPRRAGFAFDARTVRVRVRVLHRRFWAEVVRSKRWPNRDLVVIDRTVAGP